MVLKLHTAYLNNSFFINPRTKHNKYVEIKQFSKVDIKQTNISTVISRLSMRSAHLQGSRVVYIFVYTKKFSI